MAWAAPALADYRYGGYTPVRTHSGERATLDVPRCGVQLLRWNDHDAAYVDVSNGTATTWVQAGWWLGTSGTGELYRRPVGYMEYRLPDGTYSWRSLGPPPPGAVYSVYRTQTGIHDGNGRPVSLYRIDASYVAGHLATVPYPDPAGYNAGLAESYSTGGVLEPIGPASYRGLALTDGSLWRLWTAAVDAATATRASGDRLGLVNPWSAWDVAGRLRFGAAAGAPGRPAARVPEAPARPRRADRRWRLGAPVALRAPGGAVAIGALAADGRGRLVGTALAADGATLVWRWRPGDRAAAVWHLGDLRRRLGDGDAPGWATVRDGSAAYAAGHAIVWLPAGDGSPSVVALGTGGPALAAAAGPAGTAAVVRAGARAIELWRPSGRAASLALPAGVTAPDALVHVGGFTWLADQPGASDGAGPYGRIVELARAGPGRLRVVARWRRPAMYLAAGGGRWAAAGGDGARGVAWGSAGGRWRRAGPLAGAAFFGDPVAVDPAGVLWSTRRLAATTEVVAFGGAGAAARVALPPLWVREDPPAVPGGAPGRPVVADPAPTVHLAAGRGWVAAAPLDAPIVYVATARRPAGARPSRPPARPPDPRSTR